MRARAELLSILSTGEAANLTLAALLLEQEEHPAIDVERVHGEIARFAELIDQHLGGARAPSAIAERISEVLFRDLGFRGNRETYYDPQNSRLSRVIERRLGIPISLSLIYLGIGYHLRTPMAGIGFPGHFLVRIGDDRNGVLVDAFNQGQLLDKQATSALLKSHLGEHAELRPEHLQVLSPRATLARVQRNLKMIYLSQNDMAAALDACDRIVFLLPDEPDERRDRGLVYERLECFAAATRDYEAYLEQHPGSDDAQAIRERMLETSQRAAMLQ